MAARQAGPVGLSTMPVAGRTSLPGLATPNNRVHGVGNPAAGPLAGTGAPVKSSYRT
jgi:hypothetical protein